MHRPPTLLATVLLAAWLAACSGSAAPASQATGAPPAATAPPAAAAPSATTTVTPPPASPGRNPAAWARIELTDARSGETFRIADLAGRTVFIEPMAIWCTNCRRLQGEAQAALDRLDRAQILYLSLDVDPSEDAAQLARYADQLGFDWLFAVAPTSLALALADEFGDQVLNPPSTPLLLVRPDGTVELVGFGHRSADELIAIAGA